MKVLKKFDRNGQRFKPGDPAPSDLDAATLAHYKRHGMVGNPPGEATAPAPAPAPAPAAPPPGSGRQARAPRAPRDPRQPAPENTQALAPQVAQTATPVIVGQAGPEVANLLAPAGSSEADTSAVPPGEGAGAAGETGGHAPGTGTDAGPAVPPVDDDKND